MTESLTVSYLDGERYAVIRSEMEPNGQLWTYLEEGDIISASDLRDYASAGVKINTIHDY